MYGVYSYCPLDLDDDKTLEHVVNTMEAAQYWLRELEKIRDGMEFPGLVAFCIQEIRKEDVGRAGRLFQDHGVVCGDDECDVG